MRFVWDFFDDLGNIIFTIGNFIIILSARRLKGGSALESLTGEH